VAMAALRCEVHASYASQVYLVEPIPAERDHRRRSVSQRRLRFEPVPCLEDPPHCN
jgi:hypothetical protein